MTTILQLISLQGRSALVTGAGGNLGRVIADTLAELGADLVLVDHPNRDLSALCDGLTRQWGCKVEPISCDLGIDEHRKILISKLIKKNNKINILINNAAFIGDSHLKGWSVEYKDQTVETWRQVLELNTTAIFELCQGLYPLMVTAMGANIINIASIYGFLGPNWSLYEGTKMANPAAYGVSKAGILQLTRWIATTCAPSIRANALSPGGIFREQPEAFVKRYEARTPMKRMAKEDDFKGAITFLSTDMSSYLTGQNVIVDGGFGVW